MKVCAHAGEEGPAAFVWDALNVLHADRIDHGIHSVDSPALMEYLADKQVSCTGWLHDERLCVPCNILATR